MAPLDVRPCSIMTGTPCMVSLASTLTLPPGTLMSWRCSGIGGVLDHGRPRPALPGRLRPALLPGRPGPAGGQESLGVGVLGSRQHLRRAAMLDDPAAAHHGNLARDVAA